MCIRDRYDSIALLMFSSEILKFFPAEVLGGIKMLKALQGPFPDCHFFPTGGINQDNANKYLSLSNVYGVAGSWMVPKYLLDQKDWKKINKIIKKVVSK